MSARVSSRTLRRQWLGVVGRLLIVPAVMMAFAAPSAGDIGSSCDDNAGPDAVAHCRQKATIVCQRLNCRNFSITTSNCVIDASREDEAEQSLANCVALVPMMCESAAWAPDCQPTQSDVTRCYEALYTNPFDEASDNPPECQTLCGGG